MASKAEDLQEVFHHCVERNHVPFRVELWIDNVPARTEDTGKEIPMSSLASMNMWGVTPDYLDILETGFVDFLKNIPEGDIKAEYLLPIIMEI